MDVYGQISLNGFRGGITKDEHEYKSLMVPADKTKKPPPMRPCKVPKEVLKKVVDHSKEINAMLNHHTGGTVHFGIERQWHGRGGSGPPSSSSH